MSGIINGKTSWISNDNSQAIWYIPKYKDWLIGSFSKIGTEYGGLNSIGGQVNVDPNDVPSDKWKYYNKKSKQWSNPNPYDIEIECLGKVCLTISHERLGYRGF